MERGAYTDPKAYGVDYSVITDASNKAMDGVGQAMISMQEQRKAAYNKLQEDYAKYKDETYLKKMKSFDDEMNNKIRESFEMSLAEFSNSSQEVKANNIKKVKDLREMNESLVVIADVTKNGIVDKRLPKNKFLFANDLMNGENIDVEAADNGLGLNFIHYLTDPETGERTGDVEKYTDSDINAMSVVYRDVSDTLDSVEEGLDKAIGYAQKEIDGITGSRRNVTPEKKQEIINKHLEAWNATLTEEDRSI